MEHKKPRIVFVLPAITAGGAERVIITLLNNMDTEKYHVDFVTVSSRGNISGWVKNGIAEHHLNKRNIITGIWALKRKLSQLSPDIVMTTMTHSNGALLLLKPFFPSTKFIVRESSLPGIMVSRYGWKGFLCRLIYKYLYPKADLVLSPAKVIVKEFENVIGINVDNHKVLYNPVDTAAILGSLTKESDDYPDDGSVRFVCLGRLGFEKGYDELLDGLKNFEMSNGRAWHLKIIGEGNQKDLLTQKIENNGLAANVELAGYANSPWNELASSDVLLLPSRWEGLPNVVLEALVCGRRVIALSRAGGVGEISDNNDDVQIAENLDEFLHYMQQSCPVSKERGSVLPERFCAENVMSEFYSIIENFRRI